MDQGSGVMSPDLFVLLADLTTLNKSPFLAFHYCSFLIDLTEDAWVAEPGLVGLPELLCHLGMGNLTT